MFGWLFSPSLLSNEPFHYTQHHSGLGTTGIVSFWRPLTLLRDNDFQLPVYLDVHQTRNFTIIQYNKVIHITIYYFKVWLYDHVNQYYSRGVHSSGMWWNITRWLVLYVLGSLCCLRISSTNHPVTQHHIPRVEVQSALPWNLRIVTCTGW